MERDGFLFSYVLYNAGSGKTTFAKFNSERLKPKNSKTVVVNGSAEDYPEDAFVHKDATEISDLTSVSSLIWDDISLPSAPETKLLRKHLTFSKRHSKCSLYFVMHSCSSNGISSLLPHFDHAIFSSGSGNSFNFLIFVRNIARDLFPEPDDARKAWSEFVSSGADYLHYDAKLRRFAWRNLDMTLDQNINPNQVDLLKEHVKKFLVSTNREQALLLFEYILEKLDVDHFTRSFEFEISTSHGEKKHCMLLDILSVASDCMKIPTQTELSVFGALAKTISIPRCLILNTRFLKVL